MKLSAVFLASLARASEESNDEPRRGVRGFVGPSSIFDSANPWPIKGISCRSCQTRLPFCDKTAEKTNTVSLAESAESLDGRILMLKTLPVTPTLVSVNASLVQWMPMTI